MNVENLTPTPPQNAESASSQIADPVASDKPISSDNAQNSTPENETPLGGSKANAYQHGCSGSGKVLTTTDQVAVNKRITFLTFTFPPKTPRDHDLLKTVATCEVLEERCQSIDMALNENAKAAAQVHWDLNEKVAAEELALKLSKHPSLVRAQLEQTPQGVTLLSDRLTGLLQVLDHGPWTAPQQSLALDLLGVPPELRVSGKTVLDAPPGQDPRTVARAVLQRELAQLQAPAAAAARVQLNRQRRTLAEQGTPVTISREARLMKRYQAMHARRRREAWSEFVMLRQAMRTWPEEVRREHAATAQADHRPPRESDAKAAAKAPVHPAAQPVAPVSSNGSAPKPAHAPQSAPARDREKERAKKKAERQARKKAQKQR